MHLHRRKYKDPKTGERKGVKTWSCQFTVDGLRFQISLGTRDKKIALLKANKRLQEEELRAVGIETHAEIQNTRIDDLVTEYLGLDARENCQGSARENRTSPSSPSCPQFLRASPSLSPSRIV